MLRALFIQKSVDLTIVLSLFVGWGGDDGGIFRNFWIFWKFWKFWEVLEILEIPEIPEIPENPDYPENLGSGYSGKLGMVGFYGNLGLFGCGGGVFCGECLVVCLACCIFVVSINLSQMIQFESNDPI